MARAKRYDLPTGTLSRLTLIVGPSGTGKMGWPHRHSQPCHPHCGAQWHRQNEMTSGTVSRLTLILGPSGTGKMRWPHRHSQQPQATVSISLEEEVQFCNLYDWWSYFCKMSYKYVCWQIIMESLKYITAEMEGSVLLLCDNFPTYMHVCVCTYISLSDL